MKKERLIIIICLIMIMSIVAASIGGPAVSAAWSNSGNMPDGWVRNDFSGIAFCCDIDNTGMDAWWPDDPNGLIRFDSCWDCFICHEIISLFPGDIVLWRDDIDGRWTNHIAVVTDVADDGSNFLTADGNQYTDTGISLNRHYNLNKSFSSAGYVCVWRNTERGPLIAEHARKLTAYATECGYTGFRDKWGSDGWCYCYTCEILLTLGDEPEAILDAEYAPSCLFVEYIPEESGADHTGEKVRIETYTDTHSGAYSEQAERKRKQLFVYYPDGSMYDIGDPQMP